MQDKAHETAMAKGWWPELSTVDASLNPHRIASALALVHSEVSEAVECVRRGTMASLYFAGVKPTGFPTELADIVIRVADLCGAMGIDLQEAVAAKMAFNEGRSHRHGGKAL